MRSVASGGMGSVGISALPVRPTTSFTSGNFNRIFSTLALFTMLWLSDEPCGRMLWKAKSPSSSVGMNSPPMRENKNTEPMKSATATPMVLNRLRSA